ncbi:uncharacterized protein [Gossypium hirsutum]|uniref:Uncharacterized protein n=1 Tax=Gossypium hirsutum TaxID=3635 RepID=A0ABM2ZEX8_GOSHI|nr:uncharacterized protein LOC121212468 [Gossypium hirsutum]
MLTNKLPPKLKDSRSFAIPHSISNQYIGKALCVLGMSINLMPMSVFKKLGIDCKADKDVPIILGRPFLATGRTVIDVQKGELTMGVNGQQITFNVFKALKCATDIDKCHAISLLDFVVEEEFEKEYHDKEHNESDSIDIDDEEPL